MKIQINFGDIQRSDALVDQVEHEIHEALERFGDRITRVEVHLRDENAQKRGRSDKRCLIEARPAAKEPVAVDASDDDLYAAIKAAAHKMQRALDRRLRVEH
jgi:ribosomal subunit interface protein